MRPIYRIVVPFSILALHSCGATAKKSHSSTSAKADDSTAATNGYDAVLCGVSGWSDNSGYSFNADAWNPQGDGYQCLSIINASSPTDAGFDATWYWPDDPGNVHSFPHVTYPLTDLPSALSNITTLRLAAGWAMTPGSVSTARGLEKRAAFDLDGLEDIGATANVAFDMFLDEDPENSTNATLAGYEIMIWIGRVGTPYPLGYDSGNASCYTQQLGSFNFSLFTGLNSHNASVFTWVSTTDQLTFDEDISPLLQYLWRNDLVSADVLLGVIEFGSEAYYASGNVTFSAGQFAIDVLNGDPPNFSLDAIGKDCPKPKKSNAKAKARPAELSVVVVFAICTFVALSQGNGILF
ncbi:concanavalin A-like lectin/glucanase domain-containing protein [Coniella lustricola]|uniref:Concanavalin A-like lectin/glucanase domain-containing protein n=1 Tax=Coniella lustricola TaxID=2025994 RepID=A0A2T3A8X2_9PEZI|nr:concanavalin A-like lectin/glucanase domain-containing protein [Coniella lustricola]